MLDLGVGDVVTKTFDISDFNTVTTNGIYFSERLSASNAPNASGEAFGILLVRNFSRYGSIFQLFFDYRYYIYMRVNQSNTWSAWKSIALS